jgi:predicted O-linked N-acetylglucosamine transferase (SPINDLY family)
MSDSAAAQKVCAEAFSLDNYYAVNSASLQSEVTAANNERLNIGYFSADYREHALPSLVAGLFERHDRARFKLIGFAFGQDTGGRMRSRVSAAFDRFIDVHGKSDVEVIRMARDMEIDIAVDLTGFTTGCRPHVFAGRAAPVQINYLGYPGTMGAEYMDYIIGDPVVIPEEARQHYTEKVIYLPCFQANDTQRQIADRVFTREELGLPPEGFVYCCFNNNYKFTPAVFDCWMRILGRVEDSVLFLYAANEPAVVNLKNEAAARGISPDRLVFGKALPHAEYLARYRAADLFLDTLPFNAGTTASDALWAGLPVLTCAGEAFAARMAASLLHAVGLPELVTHHLDDYENLAVELAQHPDKLPAIRQKLMQNRNTTILFDTPFFAKNLENALEAVYERSQAGLKPENIWVKNF